MSPVWFGGDIFIMLGGDDFIFILLTKICWEVSSEACNNVLGDVQALWEKKDE